MPQSQPLFTLIDTTGNGACSAAKPPLSPYASKEGVGGDCGDGAGASSTDRGVNSARREQIRRQRLARLLSGDLRGMVRPASEFTFTPAAAIRATVIVHRAEQEDQR